MEPKELFITRIVDAPQDVVYRAWTDADQVVKWWGPIDYPATEMVMDVRPHGVWRGCLTSPKDGSQLWLGGTYQEVDAPHKLVFTFAWEEEGERGNQTLVTVTFHDLGSKTKMEFHHAAFESVEQQEGHSYGWNSTFDRFEAYLKR